MRSSGSSCRAGISRTMRRDCRCSRWPTTWPTSFGNWYCQSRSRAGRSRRCGRSWSRSAPRWCRTRSTSSSSWRKSPSRGSGSPGSSSGSPAWARPAPRVEVGRTAKRVRKPSPGVRGAPGGAISPCPWRGRGWRVPAGTIGRRSADRAGRTIVQENRWLRPFAVVKSIPAIESVLPEGLHLGKVGLMTFWTDDLSLRSAAVALWYFERSGPRC